MLIRRRDPLPARHVLLGDSERFDHRALHADSVASATRSAPLSRPPEDEAMGNELSRKALARSIRR